MSNFDRLVRKVQRDRIPPRNSPLGRSPAHRAPPGWIYTECDSCERFRACDTTEGFLCEECR